MLAAVICSAMSRHHQVLEIKVILTTVFDSLIPWNCAPDRLFEHCLFAGRFHECFGNPRAEACACNSKLSRPLWLAQNLMAPSLASVCFRLSFWVAVVLFAVRQGLCSASSASTDSRLTPPVVHKQQVIRTKFALDLCFHVDIAVWLFEDANSPIVWLHPSNWFCTWLLRTKLLRTECLHLIAIVVHLIVSDWILALDCKCCERFVLDCDENIHGDSRTCICSQIAGTTHLLPNRGHWFARHAARVGLLIITPLLRHYYVIITSLLLIITNSLLHINTSLLRHYYIIITWLLRHYYVIITSLLRHYDVIITSLFPHYYLIITSLLQMAKMRNNEFIITH